MGGDALDRARGERNPLERLVARIPGFSGYLERELRREVDQLLRAEVANVIDRARGCLQAHVRTLDLGAAKRVNRLTRLDKRLDTLANTLRHAGSGYAGLFSAVKVRQEQLDALYRYDLGLIVGADSLAEIAARLDTDDTALAELEQATKAAGVSITGRDAAVKSVIS